MKAKDVDVHFPFCFRMLLVMTKANPVLDYIDASISEINYLNRGMWDVKCLIIIIFYLLIETCFSCSVLVLSMMTNIFGF